MNSILNYKGDLSKLSKDDLKDLFSLLENYKIRYRNDIGVPVEESFGVEIEFGGIPLMMVKDFFYGNLDYQFWSFHEDISVEEESDYQVLGGEVSTDILHNDKEDWKKLLILYKRLKALGAKATDKTGLHIHVGAQIFKEDLEYVKRFLKVWCIFEDVIFRFGYGRSSIPRTFIKEHAMPIAPTYYKLKQKHPNFLDLFTTTKMFDFGKPKAVSFHNYHYLSVEEEVNNTIEIRCPNGTLDANIVQNNINFFLKLMLYVSSDKYDEKLINRLFSRMQSKSLEDYSLLDLKKSLFLSDLIFEDAKDKMNFLRQYVKKNDFETIKQIIL